MVAKEEQTWPPTLDASSSLGASAFICETHGGSLKGSRRFQGPPSLPPTPVSTRNELAV